VRAASDLHEALRDGEEASSKALVRKRKNGLDGTTTEDLHAIGGTNSSDDGAEERVAQGNRLRDSDDPVLHQSSR
jgi:hypothetical protein